MKAFVSWSGGKESTLALWRASRPRARRAVAREVLPEAQGPTMAIFMD